MFRSQPDWPGSAGYPASREPDPGDHPGHAPDPPDQFDAWNSSGGRPGAGYPDQGRGGGYPDQPGHPPHGYQDPYGHQDHDPHPSQPAHRDHGGYPEQGGYLEQGGYPEQAAPGRRVPGAGRIPGSAGHPDENPYPEHAGQPEPGGWFDPGTRGGGDGPPDPREYPGALGAGGYPGRPEPAVLPTAPPPAPRLMSLVLALTSLLLGAVLVLGAQVDRPVYGVVVLAVQALFVLAWVIGARPPGPWAVGAVGLGCAAVADGLAVYAPEISLGPFVFVLAAGLVAGVGAQLFRGANRTRATESLGSTLVIVLGVVGLAALPVLTRHPGGTQALSACLASAVVGLVSPASPTWYSPAAGQPPGAARRAGCGAGRHGRYRGRRGGRSAAGRAVTGGYRGRGSRGRPRRGTRRPGDGFRRGRPAAVRGTAVALARPVPRRSALRSRRRRPHPLRPRRTPPDP